MRKQALHKLSSSMFAHHRSGHAPDDQYEPPVRVCQSIPLGDEFDCSDATPAQVEEMLTKAKELENYKTLKSLNWVP
jgi:hypothetical protein